MSSIRYALKMLPAFTGMKGQEYVTPDSRCGAWRFGSQAEALKFFHITEILEFLGECAQRSGFHPSGYTIVRLREVAPVRVFEEEAL